MNKFNGQNMKTYIALLRAVNVGGTGKLPMADLRQMCMELGFENVQTYIQSGNVVFNSDENADIVKSRLENRLLNYAKNPIGVLLRNKDDLAQIIANNPFHGREPNRTIVIFTDDTAPSLDGVKHQKSEEIIIGFGAIYVYYGEGMAQSRLVIPASKEGTARNLNTVSKLLELAQNYE